MTQTEAAAAIGVSPATLRRWLRAGLVPEFDGEWTAAALGKARLIGRLRGRGYSIAQLSEATVEGRLAFGAVVELFDAGPGRHPPREVVRRTGLDREIVRRLTAMLGLAPNDPLTDGDRELLEYVAGANELGLPVEALLQLMRVYIQAVGQIADAEVRLVHLYVHEPLMRSRSSAAEVAADLTNLAGDLLPLADPLLQGLHRRMLSHFIDQDVIGHMDGDLDGDDQEIGRVAVAIAFADLAGFTELTEHAGDREAADTVERFVNEITTTLPDRARVIKTIGDGVMIVGSDAAALGEWAVALQQRARRSPRPRVGVHHGYALYRDGDYYGRAVNLAARVAAEAPEGRVLVTRPVMEAGAGSGLRFEPLDPVQFKGFAEPTELFSALDS